MWKKELSIKKLGIGRATRRNVHSKGPSSEIGLCPKIVGLPDDCHAANPETDSRNGILTC